MSPGYHITTIYCLGCRRQVRLVLPVNALIGAQAKLRCAHCDHLGAEMCMSWVWGERPPYDPIPGQ